MKDATGWLSPKVKNIKNKQKGQGEYSGKKIRLCR